MQAVQIKKIKGCLEGTNVQDILWDKDVSKEFIDYLALLGKLIYNEGSGKPFYKVIVKGKFSIKGSQGSSIARIILASQSSDELINELVKYSEKFIL